MFLDQGDKKDHQRKPGDAFILEVPVRPWARIIFNNTKTTNQIAQTRACTRMDLDCVTGYQVQYDNAPTWYA